MWDILKQYIIPEWMRAQRNLTGIGDIMENVTSEMAPSLMNWESVFDVSQMNSQYQIWEEDTQMFSMKKDI